MTSINDFFRAPPTQGPAAPAAGTPSTPPRDDLTGLDRQENASTLAYSEANADATIKGWSKDWAAALPKRSPAENARLIRAAVDATREVQEIANARKDTANCPVMRGFQAKGTYATTLARFKVTPNLPKALQVGPFDPSADYRAIVRFSNASPTAQADGEPDQRAVGFRIVGPDGKFQDITLTSGSGANHAKDAEEFVASIKAAKKLAEGGLAGGKVSALAGLVGEVGVGDALRMLKATGKAKDTGKSLAANTFYSRAPFQLGDHAVKMRLVPMEDDVDPKLGVEGTDALMQDFAARRRSGPVRYKLQVQGFKDEASTSMADHTKEWQSPWVTMGELVFPKFEGGTDALAGEVSAEISNTLAMSPFNQWDGDDGKVLKPLGDLNMLRKDVYYESAKNSGRTGPSTMGCPFLRG